MPDAIGLTTVDPAPTETVSAPFVVETIFKAVLRAFLRLALDYSLMAVLMSLYLFVAVQSSLIGEESQGRGKNSTKAPFPLELIAALVLLFLSALTVGVELWQAAALAVWHEAALRRYGATGAAGHWDCVCLAPFRAIPRTSRPGPGRLLCASSPRGCRGVLEATVAPQCARRTHFIEPGSHLPNSEILSCTEGLSEACGV